MDHSLFFCNIERNESNSNLIELLSQFSEKNSIQTYVINAPLGIDASSQYEFDDAVVVLMPKRKICFVNLGDDQDLFDEFCEDFIEDLGYLSEKFEYREQLGRPRAWKSTLTTYMQVSDISCVNDILKKSNLNSPSQQRHADFLLSLLIGSINDIGRIGGENPSTILDQVKKKIILFDGDQSRFIRHDHPTVHPGDIAVVFLEGSKANYALADSLAVRIYEKYSWKAIKGYETKDSTSDAVFISNRNNIKGLEFPFVIGLVRGQITDNVFSRNTIYMMLTRSFITSYFLVNNMDANAEFIKKYTIAAKSISDSGIMILREPPEAEKSQQNQKVSIAVAQEQRPLKEVIEETFVAHPELSAKNKQRIVDSMLEIIGEEGSMTEAEIQDRTNKMISAYL